MFDLSIHSTETLNSMLYAIYHEHLVVVPTFQLAHYFNQSTPANVEGMEVVMEVGEEAPVIYICVMNC